MKLPPFHHAVAHSVEEAIALLAEHGEESRVLAGGQSLIPLLAFRLAGPAALVDLNDVPALRYVRTAADPEVVAVGAMTTHRAVETDLTLRAGCPMIGEAVGQIGNVSVRNRGTVGGSLAHADPGGEWPCLALAVDAEVDVAGPHGTRTIAAEDLFVAPFTTTIRPDEVLTEVRFRPPPPGHGGAFVEVSPRHGAPGLAGVAAVLGVGPDGRVSQARVSLMRVGPTPVRAREAEATLMGREPTDQVLAEAAEAVRTQAGIEPSDPVGPSETYLRHLAAVLARRALAAARDRASWGADR